jgi:hypothetical protein
MQTKHDKGSWAKLHNTFGKHRKYDTNLTGTEIAMAGLSCLASQQTKTRTCIQPGSFEKKPPTNQQTQISCST